MNEKYLEKGNKTNMKRMLVTVMFLLLPLASHAAKWQEITPRQVYNLLSEGSGLWLIDVRGQQAFETAHIEGAVNISPAALERKRFPKQKILVVTGNSLGQQQARAAAEALIKSGHKRVYVLSGGIAAWERDRLPMVGDGLNWSLRQVMPEELVAAMDSGVKIDLFDLRDEKAQLGHPLFDATSIAGKSFDVRLGKLTERLAKDRGKGLSDKLKQPPVTVVALPATIDGRNVYQQHLRRLSGDVRVLDGAYLVPRGGVRRTVHSGDGCATCPE